jgi:hypothetical protein
VEVSEVCCSAADNGAAAAALPGAAAAAALPGAPLLLVAAMTPEATGTEDEGACTSLLLLPCRPCPTRTAFLLLPRARPAPPPPPPCWLMLMLETALNLEGLSSSDARDVLLCWLVCCSRASACRRASRAASMCGQWRATCLHTRLRARVPTVRSTGAPSLRVLHDQRPLCQAAQLCPA